MIVVTGTEGSSEHQVALAVQAALLKLWPGCGDSPEDEELIRIAAGAKISGYRVADIDVLIAAKVRWGRAFVPRRVLRGADGKRIERPVRVENFVAVLEVKDHDPSKCRITGDSIEVRYSTGGTPHWSSATEQNVRQMHSVRAYFDDQHLSAFLRRAVVMRGFSKAPCSGAVGGNFDGNALLTALAETAPLSWDRSEPVLRSASNDIIHKVFAAPVFVALRPTSLDRKRMDRLAARNADLDAYLGCVGKQMVRLRGRGGTGKTVMLLQIAFRAFEDQAKRSLVITYNRALAADISRLLALMRIPSDPLEGGIRVRTVMSFVTAWLARIGLVEEGEDWLGESYEAQCAAAIEMIAAGAITADDIQAIKDAEPEHFAFDLIIADEAQDWPGVETELLKRLYAPERWCLADGIDQLVRGAASDWERGVPANLRSTYPLKRCLRMKSNLAVFNNTLAERVGLRWQVEPNAEAVGGRVLILSGSLAKARSVVEGLIGEADRAGNEPVDLLVCVPARDVSRAQDGSRFSQVGAALRSWGHEVWDGVDEARRRDFPRSSRSLRVVQYPSARGLEGWTVMLEGFDVHWDSARANSGAEVEAEAEAAAWRQCIIPLTRAMDTLVIAIEDPSSAAARALLAIARLHPDICEVIALDDDGPRGGLKGTAAVPS